MNEAGLMLSIMAFSGTAAPADIRLQAAKPPA
jgi:hypothetical protein